MIARENGQRQALPLHSPFLKFCFLAGARYELTPVPIQHMLVGMNKKKNRLQPWPAQEDIEYNDRLREHIRKNLEAFDVHIESSKDLKRAAVALTVVNAAQGPDLDGIPASSFAITDGALILTRRSLKLKHHAGQWALPGGQIEAKECPREAALRELTEEVGLTVSKQSILGRLDDFITRSGFIISPIVVWGGPDTALRANPGEVASIHRIPISEFMRQDAPILWDNLEGEHPILLMPVGNSSIAAPTAAILYQFREVAISGRDTRVAHYEQPFFAWK